jgi:hypothetical protein
MLRRHECPSDGNRAAATEALKKLSLRELITRIDEDLS